MDCRERCERNKSESFADTILSNEFKLDLFLAVLRTKRPISSILINLTLENK
uniref:Uncharacterized protein n=1 Tax=Amphimedon queenslandica TaxID=400682 RepID=A0A1X7TFX6_AMPQE